MYGSICSIMNTYAHTIHGHIWRRRDLQVRAAYLEKAKTAHPDKGGDAETFCRIKRTCAF